MKLPKNTSAPRDDRQDNSKLNAPITLAADQLEAVAAGTAPSLGSVHPGEPLNGFVAAEK
jgi:hypothetical protein